MSNIIAGIALSVCLPPEDMAKLAELVTENSRLRAQVAALLKVKEAKTIDSNYKPPPGEPDGGK